MRIRTIELVIFLLLVSVFVALNWTELSRVTVLNFGITQAQGPLGLVMLGLLLLASGVFLAYALAIQTTSLLQFREHAREMKAQRELANSAEASRFSDLQATITRLDAESRERDTRLQEWFETRTTRMQEALDTRIEHSGNTLAAYVGELEERLSHLPAESPVAVRPAPRPAPDAAEPAAPRSVWTR